MLARIHSLLGLAVLGGFLVHHLWRIWPSLGGPHAWVGSARAPGPGALGAVLLAALLLFHGALGILRQRARRAEAAASPVGAGLDRLQLLTGGLALLFVGYHLAHVWAHVAHGEAPQAAPYDVYARLWRDLGQPRHMTLYLVGITAVCFHLAQGIARATLTWRAPRAGASASPRSLVPWVLAGTLGFVLWLGFLQVLGHFALGEPLLRTQEGTLQQMAEPDPRR